MFVGLTSLIAMRAHKKVRPYGHNKVSDTGFSLDSRDITVMTITPLLVSLYPPFNNQTNTVFPSARIDQVYNDILTCLNFCLLRIRIFTILKLIFVMR